MDLVDPLSEHQPPPRHALESDSEDEYRDDDGELETRFQVPKESVKLPKITVAFQTSNARSPSKGGKLLVILGLVAEYWDSIAELDAQVWTKSGSLNMDGTEVRKPVELFCAN